MVSLNISLPQLQLFFLIFFRVGAILMSIPVFDSKSIPLFFKIALAFATSIILFPMLRVDPVPMATSVLALAVGVTGEILLGLIIGFSVKLIFAGIQLAGQLAGYQMGMALANVMDPSTSQQVPLLAQFNNLFGLLIFISINEMTLTFIPKMLAVAVALIFFFPWMMQTMVVFTEDLFENLMLYVR